MLEPQDDPARTAARLWTGVLEAVNLRVQLVALELGEERKRLGERVLSAVVVVVALFMLLLSLNLALLAVFWDTHRVGVAVGSCVFYGMLAVGAALFHVRRGRRQARPLAAVVSVLAEDERALRDIL